MNDCNVQEQSLQKSLCKAAEGLSLQDCVLVDELDAMIRTQFEMDAFEGRKIEGECTLFSEAFSLPDLEYCHHGLKGRSLPAELVLDRSRKFESQDIELSFPPDAKTHRSSAFHKDRKMSLQRRRAEEANNSMQSVPNKRPRRGLVRCRGFDSGLDRIHCAVANPITFI